jgi:hypothetical protein
MSGRPFEPGNKLGKGRPTGSRNKRSIFHESLESHGIEIMETCKLQALKKDPTALRLCVERLVPVCKAPNSTFRLPPMQNAADLAKAISAVAQAVARGRLSASEGESVGRLIESQRRTLETETFEARIRALEKAQSEEEAA